MEGFQQRIDELEALGARVAGISADTFASQGAFAEKNGITFPLLSDWPDLLTIDRFDVRREGAQTAQRATFIFDSDGILHTIIDDQSDMDAHPVGALAAVKELVGQ
tara:strand:- start:906 stop:1223 length:318 start_codon:yes stop_codon:yes gene_type:complete